jgi:hypothetical protein
MNENDRGGNRRRSSRRRGGRSNGRQQERNEAVQRQSAGSSKQGEERNPPSDHAVSPRAERAGKGDRRSAHAERRNRQGSSDQFMSTSSERSKTRGFFVERPRWTPPRLGPPVLPKPDCQRCGRPIEDLAAALNDRETGSPIHFDCAIERITESETLGEGDKVVYIGGGRFGIVHFDNPNDLKRFQIKKMVQWEEKEKRSPWRKEVADQYSAT